MSCQELYPEIKRHPFKIIIFDWDGTAVENRSVDASHITDILEELLKLGVFVAVITGTNFGNIDRQFSSMISGKYKQNLFICTDRGSQVFTFNEDSQPVLVYNRIASPEEEVLLTRVAEAVKHKIESNGGPSISIVYKRLNRRKIDLIPEWENPPKSQIGELLIETEKRLEEGGFKGGIREAFGLAQHYSAEFGLKSARITSDVKHVEVGLTDKSDSMKWIINEIARKRNIANKEILVLGDEFGPIAGFEGSDFLMHMPDIPGIRYVSVGKEPNGVPQGVHYVGGGPDCFAVLMEEQVKIHKEFAITPDKSYLIEERGFEPLREREIESVFTIGNGYLGTRGSLEELSEVSNPATLVAGVYGRLREGDIEELVVVPDWLVCRIFVDGVQLKIEEFNTLEHDRILDMRKGVLHRRWRHRGDGGRITSIYFERFASLSDPHLLAMRIMVTPENYSAEIRVESGLQLYETPDMMLSIIDKQALGSNGGVECSSISNISNIVVAQAQHTKVSGNALKGLYRPYINDTGVYEEYSWQAAPGQVIELEKLVSIYTSRDSDDPKKAAREKLANVSSEGYEGAFLDSVEAWGRRWEVAEFRIKNAEDNRAVQNSINFAIYHLIIAGNYRDERVSISARTLTGTIYKGHVFWDTEMFMLPFFIYTHPDTARALLMYRYHTLGGARDEAKMMNLKGALFPWESTTTGQEMTPEFILAPNGEVILILSGKMEQHINTAISYGVWHYWTATRDEEFYVNAGAEIIIETARFWAYRAEKRNGVYHIFNVEGPDEYHEIVNDSVYTNMTARWNIEEALKAIDYLIKNHPADWERIKNKIGMQDSEFERWHDVVENLYLDGINLAKSGRDENGLIEQFEGYFALKDIDVYDYEPRTAPLDSIIGREETAASQLVKQADVVLLLYILEQLFNENTIRKNYEYYERRTGHGSSLSPSTYGLVAARLGIENLAQRYLIQASQIDLANNMGNAAGGVHGAALGGLWQQLIMGFAGVRVADEGLYVYPRLLEEWTGITFSLIWRGDRIAIDIERDRAITVVVHGITEAQMGIYGLSLQKMQPGIKYTARWNGSSWDEFKERV